MPLFFFIPLIITSYWLDIFERKSAEILEFRK